MLCKREFLPFYRVAHSEVWKPLCLSFPAASQQFPPTCHTFTPAADSWPHSADPGSEHEPRVKPFLVHLNNAVRFLCYISDNSPKNSCRTNACKYQRNRSTLKAPLSLLAPVYAFCVSSLTHTQRAHMV